VSSEGESVSKNVTNNASENKQNILKYDPTHNYLLTRDVHRHIEREPMTNNCLINLEENHNLHLIPRPFKTTIK
jgi:hypothetical protein